MSNSIPPPGSVLLLVDLQRAIDHPSWGQRNNPDAEKHIGRLLAHWRRSNWPVWHIRHDSKSPTSHYRLGQVGNDFKPEVAPLPDEPVIAKQTNSAFIATDLEQRLRDGGHHSLVIVGVITNNSVEATVRMAGNLGFDAYLVADCCFTFGRLDLNGRMWSADEVHSLSLANLDDEYCSVVSAAAALRASAILNR
jgi:nicotinamidase-related amidase